jgi:3-dehydroquinate dehydratase
MFQINKTKKGEKMKTYRVEIKSLAYYDVEANNPEEAKKQVPKSYSGELIGSCHSTHIEPNGSIFYEEFDVNNATVKEVE